MADQGKLCRSGPCCIGLLVADQGKLSRSGPCCIGLLVGEILHAAMSKLIKVN